MNAKESGNQPDSRNTEDLHITESYLRAINQFVISLIEFTRVEDLMWHVAREVVGKLDFVDCVIYLYDPSIDMLVQTAAIGDKSPEKNVIINRLKIPLGSGITGTVAQTRQPVVLGNTQSDDRYLEDLNTFNSEICVPMVYEDQLIGVIDSEHPVADYFTELHLELLTTIAAMTSGKISQCRNQKRLKTQAGIIQQVSEAVILITKDGTITECNKAAEEAAGISRSDLIGTNAFSLIADDVDTNALIPTVRQELREHEFWAGRVAIRHKKQRRLMAEVRINKLNDPENETDIYILVIRDITEQVKKERLERELQQAQKMESLGHLTGGIAHDFNNLLGIISGYSDLASHHAEQNRDAKTAKYVNQIKDASRRATNLVTQMLSFSRSQPLEDTPTALSDILQGDANMLRATLPSSIELDIDIEPDLPHVQIDSTRVHQLLMNLCVNARDAMNSSGKITIKLKWAKNLNTESPVSHRPVRGDWVELSIKDNGSGIDVSDMKKIFNPFFTTKRLGEGTGMGLSVVYKIMDEHDGHILIDSEIGQGTTFRLLFNPLMEDTIAEQDDEQILTPSVSLGNGSRILVVDDEDSLAELIARIVEEHGYQAKAMTDSSMALEEMKSNPRKYQLLITDQTMPKLTGVELISAVRQFRPDIPVILCTGYSDKVDAHLARELNIPFFDKPLDLEKLIVTISMLMSEK